MMVTNAHRETRGQRCQNDTTCRKQQAERKGLFFLLIPWVLNYDMNWYIYIHTTLICEHYRVRVIWKILYPAMKEANLVRLCLPEPPTPTSRALPPAVRIILDTYTTQNPNIDIKLGFITGVASCNFKNQKKTSEGAEDFVIESRKSSIKLSHTKSMQWDTVETWGPCLHALSQLCDIVHFMHPHIYSNFNAKTLTALFVLLYNLISAAVDSRWYYRFCTIFEKLWCS